MMCARCAYCGAHIEQPQRLCPYCEMGQVKIVTPNWRNQRATIIVALILLGMALINWLV